MAGKKTIAGRELSGAQTFVTTGECFPDGTIIELLSGTSKPATPNLLLWNGHQSAVGPFVEYGGHLYKPSEVDPTFYRAMRLPNRCAADRSPRTLFNSIRDLFVLHLGLPEAQSGLLACFAISTWLVDRLPIAPGLMITGSDEELGIGVLRLLGCLCRHPLLLAEVTASSIRSLPWQFSLTLLLNQPSLRPDMQRLFRASRHHLYLPGSKGSIVDIYGSKAVYSRENSGLDTLSGGWINISVAPQSGQRCALDEQAEEKIAEQFQPRLLMYRLKNLGSISDRSVDVSDLTPATHQIARTLAMCFPGDSRLASEAVQLLRPQDEEVRAQRYFDVSCVIIEILVGVIHNRKQSEIQVSELTKKVNSLLRSRGENLEYRPEEIGWKLRDLDVPRHSNSSGRQVLLGKNTSERVHNLARLYDLLSEHLLSDCSDCKALSS
jgi:hypothetical protein